MQRLLISAILIVLCSVAALGQTATAGKITYQKGEKPAAIIELPYSPGTVEGALRNRLGKSGVKDEKLKGMLVFKGARLTPTDGEAADMYFRIERKGKKDDNASVISLILGRPNENVAQRMADDAYRMDDAKTFLGNLTPVLAAYQLDLDIAAQEELVKKSEKSLKSLLDDQKSFENKVKEFQDKLTQNKIDQDNLNAELNKQRSLRDALLAKKPAL